MTLALDRTGEIWLGGFSYSHMSIVLYPNSDAYLARLSGAGKLLWERAYGRNDSLVITSIAPAALGGLIGVGHDFTTSWLVRIAPDGALEAAHRFGSGKGAVVVPLRSGRFIVAGFASEGEAATHQDNVSTWLLDEPGVLHGPTRIRDAIGQSGAYYGDVAASATADGNGAYVASNWSDLSHPQAVEVARVGPDGGLLWRQRLPDTISAKNGRSDFYTCDPALATLGNGDALAACALDGQIQLYRFDSETGGQRSVRLPLPECQRAHPAVLFLTVHRDGQVLLGGSRPEDNGGENCSWLGQLIMQTR